MSVYPEAAIKALQATLTPEQGAQYRQLTMIVARPVTRENGTLAGVLSAASTDHSPRWDQADDAVLGLLASRLAAFVGYLDE